MKQLWILAMLMWLAPAANAQPAPEPSDIPEQAPAGETEAPAGETEAPAGETEAPAGETEAPAGDAEAPAGEVDAPTGDAEAPAVVGETGSPAGAEIAQAPAAEQSGMAALSGHQITEPPATIQNEAAPEIPADMEAEIPADMEAELQLAGEVIEIVDTVPPGSAHTLGEVDLERFESDDVHKVLAAVPGVYIREEDGYGLRPNIGMRGTGSERSAKIALMEDGVLIAPAPYSAPAAYYFPIVTRMQRVEVLKGPAAIRHGPNTVGGALNLITRQIPPERTIELDLAGGNDLYGKAHLVYGDRTDNFGWLVEGVKLRTDGFKELDGGGDTGFDKNGVMVKLRANSDTRADTYHQLDIKLGYSDEVSNETYTGLSDEDFAANPYRRYRGTQLDRMDWQHYQAQVSHHMSLAGRFELTTTAYRHDFDRDWRKLDGFAGGASLVNVLAGSRLNPLYAVLTGMQDSLENSEMLILGTNARSFVSQGVQITGRAERSWLGGTHAMELGSRVHLDRARRYRYEDRYQMSDGRLMLAMAGAGPTRDELGSTTAWASHYQHKLAYGDWQITAGIRTELISTEHEDFLRSDDGSDDGYLVLIPGAGVVWQVRPDLGLLAGVHKGFTPVPPESAGSADPEDSINYEAGFRWSSAMASVEVIGFFSDYANLLGTCSSSSGCSPEQLGEAYNGGAVHSLGVESLAVAEPRIGRTLRVPLRLGYTFQRATFQSAFPSANPQWGTVSEGDELPYLPNHQLNVQAGVAGASWEVAVSGRYISAMRDAAGQGDGESTVWTDAATVLDLAASYALPRWGKLYMSVNNLLDEVHVTSRRPYGARPGVPRQIFIGYKARI